MGNEESLNENQEYIENADYSQQNFNPNGEEIVTEYLKNLESQGQNPHIKKEQSPSQISNNQIIGNDQNGQSQRQFLQDIPYPQKPQNQPQITQPNIPLAQLYGYQPQLGQQNVIPNSNISQNVSGGPALENIMDSKNVAYQPVGTTNGLLQANIIYPGQAIAKCENCGEPFGIQPASICHVCAANLCYKCSFLCTVCQTPTCQRCLSACLSCGRQSCNNCKVKCGMCPKIFCIFCKFQCSKCNQILSQNCVKNCFRCYSLLCKNCTIVCKNCSKMICEDCISNCKSCQSILCHRCYTLCNMCQQLYCPKCLTRCKGCNKDFCSKCAGTCKDCKTINCGMCAYFCPTCGGTHCQNCGRGKCPFESKYKLFCKCGRGITDSDLDRIEQWDDGDALFDFYKYKCPGCLSEVEGEKRFKIKK